MHNLHVSYEVNREFQRTVATVQALIFDQYHLVVPSSACLRARAYRELHQAAEVKLRASGRYGSSFARASCVSLNTNDVRPVFKNEIKKQLLG